MPCIYATMCAPTKAYYLPDRQGQVEVLTSLSRGWKFLRLGLFIPERWGTERRRQWPTKTMKSRGVRSKMQGRGMKMKVWCLKEEQQKDEASVSTRFSWVQDIRLSGSRTPRTNSLFCLFSVSFCISSYKPLLNLLRTIKKLYLRSNFKFLNFKALSIIF